MEKIRHIFFEGRVQGVGFRYTAKSVAQKLGLSGWVRNLRDGRVELIVKGDKDKIERFLNEIRQIFRANIYDIKFVQDTDSFTNIQEGFFILPTV